MEKKRITCAEARAWINNELDSKRATKGLSLKPFSRYDPQREPSDLLVVVPGEATSKIALGIVRSLWKEIGERFEVEPDLVA